MHKNPPQTTDLLPTWESTLQIENMDFQMLTYAKLSGPISQLHLNEVNLSLPVDVLHTHLFSELFFCLEGTIYLLTPQKVIPLDAGDLALVPAGCEHLLSSGTDNASWSSLIFSCIRKYNRSNVNIYSTFQKLCNGSEPLILKKCPVLCRELSDIVCSGQQTDHSLNSLRLLSILLRIIDIRFDKEAPLKTDTPSVSMNINRITQLEELIEDHFMENLHEEDFASILKISTRHLERIVKSKYGCSLHQLITEKRLQTARRLLKGTSLTAEQISLAVGYQSKTNFYKAFTKKYGVAPCKYRKTGQ